MAVLHYSLLTLALVCACALASTGYEASGPRSQAGLEPCPHACRCTTAYTGSARHRWHRLLAAYRMRRLVYGKDKAGVGFDIRPYRAKPEVTSSDGPRGREMTCLGLQALPASIPRDVSKLTLYGDSRGHPMPRGEYQADVAGTGSSDDVSMIYHQLTSIGRYSFRASADIRELSVEGNSINVIHANDFEALRNLRKLRMKENQLKVLWPRSLSGLKQLHDLDLSQNHLRTLAKSVLLDVPNLKTLDLSKNRIRGIPKKSFSDLKFLEHLDLSENFLKDLHKDIFIANSQLKILRLDYNYLGALRKDWFENLNNLQQLSAKGNAIMSLDQGTFHSLPNLISLNLESNKIERIGSDDLEGLDALEYLTLKKNNVTDVGDGAFRHSVFMKKLSLDWNRITSFSSLTFSELSNLIDLSVSGNKIQELPHAAISGLKKLERLNLAHNALKIVRQRNFYGLLQLKELRLDHNNIRAVEDEGFAVSVMSHYSQLTWLYLNHNDLGQLNRDMMYGLAFLKFLTLSNNEISSIGDGTFSMLARLHTLLLNDNRVPRLDPAIFKHQRLLRHLNMASNHIRDLSEPQILQGLAVLEDLNLQDNLIQDVKALPFQMTPKLISLTLKGNKLRELNLDLLDTMKKLKYLDASRNGIYRVTPPAVRQPRLRFLSVADNKLSTLEDAMMNVMVPAGEIHLYSNPWTCDCRLSWLYRMIGHSRFDVVDKEDVVCKAPYTVEGERITALTAGDFRCSDPRSTHGTTVRGRSHSAPVYVPGLVLRSGAVRHYGTQYGGQADAPSEQTAENVACDFLPGAMEQNTRTVVKSTKDDVIPWIAVLYDVTSNSTSTLCAGVRLHPRWLVTSSLCAKTLRVDKSLGLKFGLDAAEGQIHETRVKQVLTPSGSVDIALVETERIKEESPTRVFPCVLSKDAIQNAKSGRANGIVSLLSAHHVIKGTNTFKVKGIPVKMAGKKACRGDDVVCVTGDRKQSALKVSGEDDLLRPSPLWAKVGRSRWALAGFTRDDVSGDIKEFGTMHRAANWLSRYTG